MKLKSITLSLAFSFLVLTGCNSTADKSKGILQSYAAGDLQAAVKSSASLVNGARKEDLPVVELNAALPNLAFGNSEESAQLMESWKMKSAAILTDVPDIRLSDAVLNTLSNATRLQYWSNPRETIMGSSVGALACLLNGNPQGARSNMAAAREFQLDALSREPDRLKAEMSALQRQRNMNTSILATANQKYKELNLRSELTAVDYPMFLNPFSLWLNAVFYSTSDLGDQEKAKGYFSRVDQILGTPTSKRDLDWSQRSMDDGGTWVLDFAGSAPLVETLKVPIPMGDQGAIATFGFPYLRQGNAPPPPVVISCDGNASIPSDLLCDYEGLAKKDFDAKLPIKIASEVFRGLVSGAINQSMQEEKKYKDENGNIRVYRPNPILKAGLNNLNAAIAESDERSWVTAPAKIRLARLGMASGPINIFYGDMQEPITLSGKDGNGVRVIVLFRPMADAPIAIQEFTLRAK